MNFITKGFTNGYVVNGFFAFVRVEDKGYMTNVCISLTTLLNEVKEQNVQYELIELDCPKDYDEQPFYTHIKLCGVEFPIIYSDLEGARDEGFVKVECFVSGVYEGHFMDGGYKHLAEHLYRKNELSHFASHIVIKYQTNNIHAEFYRNIEI